MQSAGVLALHEIRWHLTKSSGWVMPFDNLRMSLRLRDSVPEAVDRFLRDGFEECKRRLDAAQKAGPTWQRLVREVNLLKLWERVEESVIKLKAIGVGSEAPYRGIESAMAQVESSRISFVEGLDQIAARPGSILREVTTLSDERKQTSTRFTIQIEEDCPSIAMGKADFREVMYVLVENALEWTTETTFNFRGDGRRGY
jgi:hypothetical protein